MNILFYYTTTYNVQHGGIARVSQILGKALSAKGHKIIYLSKNKTTNSQVENQCYFPIPQNMMSLVNRDFFVSLVSEYRINVIINQCGTTPSQYEVALWANQQKIPVITVVHNSLEGLYRDNEMIAKIFPSSKLRHPFVYWLYHKKWGKHYHRITDLSSKVVTLSEKFFEEVVAFSGKEVRSKLIAIPNPCTLEGCKVMPHKEKELLYVGRLSQEKQVPLLLHIWKRLEEKNPEWKLTIVGDGKEREKCLEVSSKLNLKRVCFVGHQDNPAPFYEKASIFCMTSSFEGFGLVLVEAMSYYTIPIAFNSYANVSDIIANEKCGFIIEPFNIEGYCSSLQKIIDNETLRNNMATEAKLQSYKFSLDKIVVEWERLFESIL